MIDWDMAISTGVRFARQGPQVSLADARAAIDGLAPVGVDFGDVARVLEDEGVASFAKSFDELIQALTTKANALSA